MEQIAAILKVLNTISVDGFKTSINQVRGAKLSVDGKLDRLRLTAADGEELGLTISSEGFGIRGISLPSPEDPSIGADPYLERLELDLAPPLFARLAEMLDDPTIAEMHKVVDRVVCRGLQVNVRLTTQKMLHVDVALESCTLCQGPSEMIRVKNLRASLVNFDTTKPPKQAQKDCQIVLRDLDVEVLEIFFARVLEAVRSQLPPVLEEFHIELPGPKMVCGGVARVKLPIKFRVDLSLETENDLFGIHFERFYVPGTNMRIPSMVRNMLLGLVRSTVEKKAKGLIEVSNESIRINPWSKIPVSLVTAVHEFAVREGLIIVSFREPRDRHIPAPAVLQAETSERVEMPGATPSPLAPGPALR